MGAWIEIAVNHEYDWAGVVAPYMGAWIEMNALATVPSAWVVAPYMGAWIEMYMRLARSGYFRRRTLYGCVD